MSAPFCTWIDRNRLMASRRALTTDEFSIWSRAGMTLVINLDVEPDDHVALGERGMRYRHFPIEDFTAPSRELLTHVVAEIRTEIDRGGAVCVHCRAGLGRTGTVVASWLVWQGMEAGDAIDRVRALRPGSVETEDQVTAIHDYASWLRSRISGND